MSNQFVKLKLDKFRQKTELRTSVVAVISSYNTLSRRVLNGSALNIYLESNVLAKSSYSSMQMDIR